MISVAVKNVKYLSLKKTTNELKGIYYQFNVVLRLNNNEFKNINSIISRY